MNVNGYVYAVDTHSQSFDIPPTEIGHKNNCATDWKKNKVRTQLIQHIEYKKYV